MKFEGCLQLGYYLPVSAHSGCYGAYSSLSLDQTLHNSPKEKSLPLASLPPNPYLYPTKNLCK